MGRVQGAEEGALLRSAEEAGYAVFLTVDAGIRYQPTLSGLRIAMIVIRRSTNRMEELRLLVPAILKVLGS